MRLSTKRTRLAYSLGASMLVMASAAYAIDPPNPAPISLGQVNVTANVGDVTDLPEVTVTATAGPSADDLHPLGVVQGGVSDLVGRRAYLYLVDSSTASTDATTSNDKSKDPNGGCAGGNIQADPIDLSHGTEFETFPIFSMPGEMGLSYTLYYNQSFKNGNHWSNNLAYSMDTTCGFDPNNNGNCQEIKYYRADGSTLLFNGKPGLGPFTVSGGSVAALSYNASSSTYTLQDEGATTKTFDASGNFIGMKDASGIGWSISEITNSSGSTTTITHTNGQSYTLNYQNTSQVVNGVTVYTIQTQLTDPAGNVYNLMGVNYTSVSFPGSPATVLSFKYTQLKSSVLSEIDYNGTPYQYISYVSASTDPHYTWANGSYLADGSQNTSISYGSDAAFHLQATVTNALGHQSTQDYAGTNGSGGTANGYLSTTSDNAVQTCGATVHGRAYDVNGHLSETIDNNGNIHTYTYSTNGQLQSETEAYGTPIARTTDYVWDANPQLNRLVSETVEGWRKTSYTYNAQNRLASISVTNLSSNGSTNQTLTTAYGYTLYANGMVQTMTVTHPSPSGTNTDTYTYDALGNLTALSNGLGQTTNYSNYSALGKVGHVVGPNGDVTDYTYDGRGRVITKTTYPNSSAATWTYAYDGFGLTYSQTGPDGQVTTWNRDPSSMRVNTITHNDKDGASTESFSYDANGDVIEHKVARGGTVGLDEVFHYDALGRVYQKIGQNGQSLTYAYDGNGNVLSVTDAIGHTVSRQYDALNRVTQTTESGGASPVMPTSTPTINVPSSSTSGAYTVSWNSITGATYYVLQEQVGGGSWSTVQSSSAISWSPTGKTTNAYSYQVKACNATGCGPFSSPGTINVNIPTAPTSAPNLSVPASNANGSYTVSWTSVANTSTYNLQEQVNGGSWNTIQNSTSLSWSVNGKGNGTYAYRAQACNAVGCGPWSNTGTMVETWPPIPATPSINVPSRNYSGSYTVSWNAVANASSYPLYQSINGGSWTLVQNNGSTSWTVSGQGNAQYNYLVSACDISGCGAQSGGAVIVVIPAPIAINGQQYLASHHLSTGSGNQGIGFDITAGTTWEVFKTIVGNPHVVMASGAVPASAVSVQYTWIDAGVPSGDVDAGGSITNSASSPVALSSNPSTQYTTGTFTYKQPEEGHQYNLRIDFYDVAGQNISSSTCLLIGEVTGSQ